MSKVLIIAEAGVNHNGSVELAKKLIDTAKIAGADIVKFQTSNIDAAISKKATMAEYQKENIGKTESQYDMLKKITLPYDAFIELNDYCKKVGITFLSTAFDIDSVHFLDSFNMPFWKVPSGEVTNYPLLIEIAKTKKPVVLSTGMCTIKDVRTCYDLLKSNGTPNIIVLHCTTQYPTPYEDVNLNAMLTLKKEFNCAVGYSDHTNGIEVPIAAVAMGATVIEKHFTLDRNMEGPDHKASLEPNELKNMVESIRHIEVALGTGIKAPQNSEKCNIDIARKSIVAKCNIKKGETFTENNIIVKRPGNGISPMRWNEVLGKIAIKDFNEDDLIEL